VVQENQQVTDTVRHEEARIEREGNVQIEGEEDPKFLS
jgi:stress response protein YsnF